MGGTTVGGISVEGLFRTLNRSSSNGISFIDKSMSSSTENTFSVDGEANLGTYGVTGGDDSLTFE